MYFKEFPAFLYEFDIKGKPTAVTIKDITRNIRFRRDVLSNITVFDEYDILDGETPEHIAEKVYGDSGYHWVIMLSNDRYDYIADFPLTTVVLEKYIVDKYGVSNEYATHHYVDANGFIVNSDTSGATSVSNYQYEELHNESKRRIKIIPKSTIDIILKNFKDLI
jgi:hypothetical protein